MHKKKERGGNSATRSHREQIRKGQTTDKKRRVNKQKQAVAKRLVLRRARQEAKAAK